MKWLLTLFAGVVAYWTIRLVIAVLSHGPFAPGPAAGLIPFAGAAIVMLLVLASTLRPSRTRPSQDAPPIAGALVGALTAAAVGEWISPRPHRPLTDEERLANTSDAIGRTVDVVAGTGEFLAEAGSAVVSGTIDLLPD